MSEIQALHLTHSDEDNDKYFAQLVNQFSSHEQERDPTEVDIQKKKKSRYATNTLTQFRWLVWRNFVDVFKNPFQIRLSLILAIVCLYKKFYFIF